VVLSGQYLERPALIDAEGVTLDGLYHRGTRLPALLICPAPGPGGGMDASPLAELAWAAARAGHPSLRFQHRGVGASQGASDPALTVHDAEAAFRHLAETVGARVAVAALGAGAPAALALARAHPGIERVVLIAPDRLPDTSGVGSRILALLPETGSAVSADELAVAVGPAGRVEVIAGADPAFRAGLGEVGRRTVAWIGG
jgi:alpha/beta superfamily hydrolase